MTTNQSKEPTMTLEPTHRAKESKDLEGLSREPDKFRSPIQGMAFLPGFSTWSVVPKVFCIWDNPPFLDPHYGVADGFYPLHKERKEGL